MLEESLQSFQEQVESASLQQQVASLTRRLKKLGAAGRSPWEI